MSNFLSRRFLAIFLRPFFLGCSRRAGQFLKRFAACLTADRLCSKDFYLLLQSRSEDFFCALFFVRLRSRSNKILNSACGGIAPLFVCLVCPAFVAKNARAASAATKYFNSKAAGVCSCFMSFPVAYGLLMERDFCALSFDCLVVTSVGFGLGFWGLVLGVVGVRSPLLWRLKNRGDGRGKEKKGKTAESRSDKRIERKTGGVNNFIFWMDKPERMAEKTL